MFLHVFKNTFKLILRQKELLFWAFVFPILLAGLFKMTLSHLDNEDQFKAIPVAYVLNETNPMINQIIDSLDGEIFDVTLINKSEKEEVLKEVIAVIDYPTMTIKENGLEASIVENVLNEIKQTSATLSQINDPTLIQEALIKLNNSTSHFVSTQNKEMNFSNTYFYTLLGMQSVYGYMFGLQIIYYFEANLSTYAKRQAVAPIKKSTAIFSSILVGWIIQMAIMAVAMLILRYGLNVGFGHQTWPILLLIAVGSWVGVALGVVIGTSNRKSIDTKVGLGITISMLMSFLAGMMVAPIRPLIERSIPILAKINPVHVITNALYSLYYYDSLSKFWGYLFNLLIIAIVLSALGIYLIRGKQYDSL